MSLNWTEHVDNFSCISPIEHQFALDFNHLTKELATVNKLTNIDQWSCFFFGCSLRRIIKMISLILKPNRQYCLSHAIFNGLACNWYVISQTLQRNTLTTLPCYLYVLHNWIFDYTKSIYNLATFQFSNFHYYTFVGTIRGLHRCSFWLYSHEKCRMCVRLIKWLSDWNWTIDKSLRIRTLNRLSCKTFLMATNSLVSISFAWKTTPKLPFPITRVSVYDTSCTRSDPWPGVATTVVTLAPSLPKLNRKEKKLHEIRWIHIN